MQRAQKFVIWGKTNIELFLKSSGVGQYVLLTQLLYGTLEVNWIDLSLATHQLLQNGIVYEDILSLCV